MTNTEKDYTVVLSHAGTDYKSKGKTLVKALDGIKLTRQEVKSKGIFTIHYGKKSYEHLMYVPQLRRFISIETPRIVLAKFWENALR